MLDTDPTGTAGPFGVITRSGKSGTPWLRMQETNFSSCGLEPEAGAVVVEPMLATLVEGAPPQAARSMDKPATTATTRGAERGPFDRNAGQRAANRS
jgi:hypothetical protein